TLADIQEARRRLQGIAEQTPIYLSETFSRRSGREVRLKAENLQRTGSFKIRGAVNKLSSLSPEQRAAGVVAASAGNHGQAVAWAARKVGARARIYMPQDAPMAKVEATRNYGAEIELTGPAIEECLDAARDYVESAGAALLGGKVGGSGCAVPVLSGGNIDATLLISVARHGLAVAGRYLVLRTRVPDRPGELAKLLTLLAQERVNVVEVEHQRETAELPVGDTGVELTLVTRDPAHCE